MIDELSHSRVLAMELIQGVPLDHCVDLDQETRNQVQVDPAVTVLYYHFHICRVGERMTMKNLVRETMANCNESLLSSLDLFQYSSVVSEGAL